jgi:hypothetical protein
MKRNRTIIQKRQGKELRQNAFLESYKSNLFNITAACRAVGIHRSNYYRWIDEDLEFAQQVKLIQEEKLDFIESKLMEQIKSGNIVAIIFALKCLGKGRGYIEQHNLRVTAGEEDFSKEQKDAAVDAFLMSIQFEQEQLTAGDQDANPIIDVEPSQVKVTVND